MAKETKKDEAPVNNNCFVIMPITDPDGYDKGHFRRVYEDIFKVACVKAGFVPIRADQVKQTNLIHLDILRKLIESPMAICDLSNRNPNVLFELGLRQAFDKPTVLVQEFGTPQIFDIAPMRYTEYRKELKYRDVLEDQEIITEAIKATKEAAQKGDDINSIVKLLSLTNPASLKEVSENNTSQMFQVIMAEISNLKSKNENSSLENQQKLFVSPQAARLANLAELYSSLLSAISLKNNTVELRNIFDNMLKIASLIRSSSENNVMHGKADFFINDAQSIVERYIALSNKLDSLSP